MANKRRKKSSSILPLKTFQLPIALVVMGLTMIGASYYVGSSNAASTCEVTNQADLAAAKVTCKEAQKTALDSHPNYFIKSGELEHESGQFIWSFDMPRKRGSGPALKEVWVDAVSGKISKVTTESPSQISTENNQDKTDANSNSDNTVSKKKPKKADVCNHYVKVDNLNGNNGKPKDKQMNFVFNSTGQGGKVTVTGKAGKGCIGKKAILAVYTMTQPPTAKNTIQMQKQQKLFGSTTAVMTKQPFTMQTNIPNCYYQIDVAFRKSGLPLNSVDKAMGKTYHNSQGFTWGTRGGKNSCSAPPPPPPPPPSCNPAVNAACQPPAAGEVPTKEINPILPATGDNNLTLFGLAAVASGLVLALYRRRQLTTPKRRR